MDLTIKRAAEEFVRFIRSTEEMKQFQSARERYQNNPEIMTLREHILSLTRQLQQKQYTNTISQKEITHYKKMQKRLNDHPLHTDYARARQHVVELLQACNAGLSDLLGFDFATTAAPTACC